MRFQDSDGKPITSSQMTVTVHHSKDLDEINKDRHVLLLMLIVLSSIDDHLAQIAKSLEKMSRF